MIFKKYIENKGVYEKLCKYGHGILHKSFKGESNYLLNQEEKEDVIASVFEDLSVKNMEITNNDSFMKGYFSNYVWNKGASYLNSKHKKKLFYSKSIDFNIKDTEYIPESYKYLERITHKKTKAILNDKFYNGLSLKELQKKYKITDLTNTYKIAKREIMGEYRGIARVKDDKIDKVYPKIADVEVDGFNRTTISKCVNGKLKSNYHANYKWVYLKDFKTKENERLNNTI